VSYIAKPGSMVAHIFNRPGLYYRGPGDAVPSLYAKCAASFPEPSKTAYFVNGLQVGRRHRRVCRHCARIARAEALSLLRDAAGDRP